MISLAEAGPFAKIVVAAFGKERRTTSLARTARRRALK
jgi:hypothetical protein